tara:strand:+ start:3370 stop:3633 length:264 start_codon:yes stop_codon:yes gene_type:complete
MKNKRTKKQTIAFNKLKQLGIPVKNSDDYDDDRGVFWIDCEEYGAELHLDYWSTQLMCGSDKLNKILNEAGLYFEWYNSAYACVYEQ